MTPNERKIINFLRDAKEKTHIRLVAQKANFSSDYTRLLCRSLARSGHIKFENDLVHLLKKGGDRFSAEGGSASGGENKPADTAEKSELVTVAANVTLLTDEPDVASPANERSDEEENKEEGASEEKDKPEEPKDETENELRELEEQKTEEIAEEPKEEIDMDRKKDALNKEVLAGTEATEGEKMEKPDETELKPEPKIEEKKEKETASEVEMKTATDAADGKEEGKAENPEKVALKEKLAKPSGSFGVSFKKIVNWFTEKK